MPSNRLDVIRVLTGELMNPRSLLVFDAIGAALTGLATGLLLASERVRTGLPTELLYALSIVAFGFMGYDLVSYCFSKDAAKSLRIIALLNLAYCAVVVVSLVAYRSQVTGMGLIYFRVESVIVFALAIWELRVSRFGAGH